MNCYDKLGRVDALTLGKMVDDQFDEVIRAREYHATYQNEKSETLLDLATEVYGKVGAEMLLRELAVMDLSEYDIVHEAEKACYVGDFSGIIEANGLNEDAR